MPARCAKLSRCHRVNLNNISKASLNPLRQSKRHTSSSLLDTLPHFMALSAAQLMLQGSHITEIWMKLAAGYMTHAVMEQYFAHGEHGVSVIQRAFSWGFDEQSTSAEGTDECQINAMFFDEDKDTQVEGWEKTRHDHINAVRYRLFSLFLPLTVYLTTSLIRSMVSPCHPIYDHWLPLSFRPRISSNVYLNFWTTYIRVNQRLWYSRLAVVNLMA